MARNDENDESIFSGFSLPQLAVGTFMMGGEYGPDYSRDSEHIRALRAAISLGYSHIDTAECYARGHAEELVGEAISGLDRQKLFITTKVSPSHLCFDDVVSSCKASLERLRTGYIDLYLIHAYNPDVGLKETMDAMNYLADRRLVRHIGVSNFTRAQMSSVQSVSKRPVAANQLEYSIFARHIDLDAISCCQENGIAVIAYMPFGRGELAKNKPGPVSALSEKYNKTGAQVILRWLVEKKGVVALFKSADTRHLEENKDIFDFALEPDDSALIDSLVAKGS